MATDHSVTLWNRVFRRVGNGLDEHQVIAFVDEMMAKLNEARENAEKRSYPSALDRLAERTVLEAEKLADKLKEEAEQIRTRARAEAARIAAEAQVSAEEHGESISKMARSAAQEANTILQAAREKGASIEADGRRRAEELIEFTRSQLESQVRGNVKGAAEKLLDHRRPRIGGSTRSGGCPGELGGSWPRVKLTLAATSRGWPPPDSHGSRADRGIGRTR